MYPAIYIPPSGPLLAEHSFSSCRNPMPSIHAPTFISAWDRPPPHHPTNQHRSTPVRILIHTFPPTLLPPGTASPCSILGFHPCPLFFPACYAWSRSKSKHAYIYIYIHRIIIHLIASPTTRAISNPTSIIHLQMWSPIVPAQPLGLCPIEAHNPYGVSVLLVRVFCLAWRGSRPVILNHLVSTLVERMSYFQYLYLSIYIVVGTVWEHTKPTFYFCSLTLISHPGL